MAPELMEGRPPTLRADVFSYAVVLWELLFLAEPYENFHHKEALWARVPAGERPLIPASAEQEQESWVGLMGACWAATPEARPGFKAVIGTLHKLRPDAAAWSARAGLVPATEPERAAAPAPAAS
jgi:hypothetical protein